MTNFLINLKDVKYPSGYAVRHEKNLESQRASLLAGSKERPPMTLEVVNRFIPVENFDQVEDLENAIQTAFNNFLNTEYNKKDNNSVDVPHTDKKIVAQISRKMMDSTDGTFELDETQLDYILKCLRYKGPRIDTFFYLEEYLDELKAKTTTT